MARARRNAAGEGTKRPAATESAAATTAARPESSRVARALKWIGGVTAVLSLIFGLVQATTLVSNRIERGRRVRELLQVAQQQLAVGDHQAAWASATAAGEVDPRSSSVRRTQEDVAMAWVREATYRGTSSDGTVIPGPRSFTEVVDPLVPTLDRGALDATGPRKADLLAHRGWADFLRLRDNPGGTRDPARLYKAAVEADAGNPFAHAMWGHWIAWNHGPLKEALGHFAAAAAAGRERAYVRDLQLAALRNDGSPESEAEVLRVVNAVRLDGGTLDAGTRRRIHGTYWHRMRDTSSRAALLAALPPDAHLATYRWLFEEDLRDSTREASYWLHLAQLQEHAGDSAGALATFRTLDRRQAHWPPRERAIIDAALARGARSATAAGGRQP